MSRIKHPLSTFVFPVCIGLVTNSQAQSKSASIGLSYSIEALLYSPARTTDLGKVSHAFNVVADTPFYTGNHCSWGFRTGICIRRLANHTEYSSQLPDKPKSMDTEVVSLHIPMLASFNYNLKGKTKMSALLGLELGSYLHCLKYFDYGDGPEAVAFPWRTTNLDALPVSFVLAHSFRWNLNQTWGLFAEPYASYHLNSGFYELNHSIWIGLNMGILFQ